MISFNTTKDEAMTIHAIAKRAAHEIGGDLLDWDMDVTAVHANGTPLRLDDLADCGVLDFAHDLCGIRRHIDRTTGKLTYGFLPRFAVNQ